MKEQDCGLYTGRRKQPIKMSLRKLRRQTTKQISELAILNMFKELKGRMRTRSHQRDNTNKEIKIIILTKKRNSRVEKYNNWNEKFSKGFASRFEQVEERISKFEDRTN